MAGWFPVAALCLLNCSAVSFVDEPGFETYEACTEVLARTMHEDHIMEFVEIGGSVKAECLPAVVIRNRQPEYFLEWLNGKAPGERA